MTFYFYESDKQTARARKIFGILIPNGDLALTIPDSSYNYQ
jgi:hypothetical protein